MQTLELPKQKCAQNKPSRECAAKYSKQTHICAKIILDQKWHCYCARTGFSHVHKTIDQDRDPDPRDSHDDMEALAQINNPLPERFFHGPGFALRFRSFCHVLSFDHIPAQQWENKKCRNKK